MSEWKAMFTDIDKRAKKIKKNPKEAALLQQKHINMVLSCILFINASGLEQALYKFLEDYENGLLAHEIHSLKELFEAIKKRK